MMMTPRGDLTQTHDKEDPDCWCELCHPGAESRMIEYFDADGKPILFFKESITGHCPWNEDCSCEQCVEEDFVQEIEGGYHTSYNPHRKKKNKKKNSIHSQLYQRWKNGDSTVGPLGEDNGKFVFLVDYGPRRKEEITVPDAVPQTLPPSDSSSPPSYKKKKPVRPVQPCYKKIQRWIKKNPIIQKEVSQSICMFTPAGSSYNKDFPLLEEFTEKEFRHIPKIPTQLHGEKISAAEATLNWQTENALAQNATLQRIDARVAQMNTKITMVETKVDSNTKIANELIVHLHRMLKEAERRPAEPGQDLFYHVEQKNQEIQRLKDHIKYLQEHGLPPSAQSGETLFPSRSAPSSIFSPFERRTPPSSPKETKQSSESENSDNTHSIETQSSSDDEIHMAIPEVKTEEVDPMDTDASPSVAAPPPFQINSGKHTFTLDDIPSTRWPQRLQEFQAWMDTQKLTREISRHLQSTGKRVENLTIVELQQETYMALEDICDRKKIIKNYLTGSKEIAKACKNTKFQIKCGEKGDCHCRQKKRFRRRSDQRPFRTPAYPRSLRRKRK
ncbi:hypothetical protein V6N11_017959 [Hibiscus sabdariffa]|uniref:Uncharacterized protein n=1 Tax=Hibiscus sabdariffa TaxID=183260 RepID=A0ABR2T6W1_9ROSI